MSKFTRLASGLLLVLMGQIASSTGVPKAFFQAFGLPLLAGLEVRSNELWRDPDGRAVRRLPRAAG